MKLVIGATGHIGNTLVRELKSDGEAVRALNLPGEDTVPLEGLDIEKVEGNVLDQDCLERAMQGVDTVYHLASMISILPGKNVLMRKVNVEGTLNVIRAARASGVHRLVYTSSIHAIQRAPEGVVIDESLPFDSHNPAGEYDRTKAAASLAVLEAVDKQDLDAVIVCPTGVIGPQDYRLSEMGQLLVDWMKRRLHILVSGFFDFVDVRDVARGHILAAQKGKTGQTYILGGERISLPHILEYVQEASGVRSPFICLPCDTAAVFAPLAALYYRLARVTPRFTPYALETVLSNSHISSARACRELGFAPRGLQESVKDTVAWWQTRLGKQSNR